MGLRKAGMDRFRRGWVLDARDCGVERTQDASVDPTLHRKYDRERLARQSVAKLKTGTS